MRGNLVILVSGGDLTVISGNRYGVSTSVVKGVSLKAFVIQENRDDVKPRQEPPAPAPAPAEE